MKFFIGFVIFVWLICGLTAAWMMDDWRPKTIAKGPISLAEAYDAAPEWSPGPY